MTTNHKSDPEIIIEYTDPLEGFKGWLAIDRTVHRISAGGMRVQPGLTREHLAEMAGNMTRKMQMADLRVDGAKCGIDYDPSSPGKSAAISRFIRAISPYIKTNYSMGPDLNVDMMELEEAARPHGIPSVKMAIATAQGWDLDYFLKRYEILSETIGDFTLGRLRAGYGVAAAVLGVLQSLDIEPSTATISVQGFGNLAKAALYGLSEEGCRIVAIADEHKCLSAGNGLDTDSILAERSSLLPGREQDASIITAPSEALFDCDCDILVPAALENTVTPEIAAKIKVKAIVPGANLAVPEESGRILHERGIPVVPDFLAGCGGSLSMEGLFSPEEHPSPQEVLTHVKKKMQDLVRQVITLGDEKKCSLTEAALDICSSRKVYGDSRPYGREQDS